ncbi:diguanylate cyclase [Oscillatoria acuminata]|uniref:PAS domain S-box/diguanylate cyclase (GGDEF) domain-containing protein n=1 Tax=Oscillatoria acuminata PCC 6304 TaxID=56110 RepID=K9TKT9_9CYAN|nr:diguanylate cyclase [Oscillatoria acuminata]AFY83472.1 PAS domain S-box/diguanylate cyclase (GGDEF) domain-containing protein [Oscillatoria acuminata PCC 6304]
MIQANRLLCSFDIESAIDRNVQIVSADTPLIEAIALMKSQGQSADSTVSSYQQTAESFSGQEGVEPCLFVMNETHEIGLLTPRDILEFLGTEKSWKKTPIAAVMQKCSISLKESDCFDICTILNWFQQGVHYLPVLSDSTHQIVGCITPSRLLQRFYVAPPGKIINNSVQAQHQEQGEISVQNYPKKSLISKFKSLSNSSTIGYKKRPEGRIGHRIKIMPYMKKTAARSKSLTFLSCLRKTSLDSNCLTQNFPDIFSVMNFQNSRQILTENDRIFLKVFAAMTEIILVIDKRANLIKIAPTHPVVHRSEENSQLISQTLDFFFNGSQAETFLGPIRESLQTQTPIRFDYLLNLGKQQKKFTANISPLSNHSVIWAAQDITEHYQTIQALQYSESLLRGVLNSSLDGIMAFKAIRNSEGTIIDFQWLTINPIAEKIVGRRREDVLGKYLLQEMPGNLETGLFQRYVEVVNTQEPLELEFYYNHEGIQAWFKMMAVKLDDGFTVTFRNITEDKQAEATLQQANDKLIRWVEELKQRNREMALLGEMNELLQACETLEEAYKAIGLKLPQLFPSCSGGLAAINSFTNRVETVATWGKLPGSKPWFSPHECWALRRGRSHRVDNSPFSLFCDHLHSHLSPVESLCIPMMAQGEISGLLYLICSYKGRLSDAKQQLARTVSEQIALALANIKLRETLHTQSIRDSLTGLFNRRYLEETLERELQRAHRQDQSVGIVMIDIDHFKHFNDTFGHDAGDAVLRQVGELLMKNIRGSDIACRYGGEELTLILPDATLSETYRRAEQIREAIKNLVLEHRGELLGIITASLGIACYPTAGVTGDDLIRAADTALYRAKALGRDRVVTAGSYPI